MSDRKDLITLNCPNCQAPLSCESSEMTITCEHCGTSVLIKDLITESRINNEDQLESYRTLAKNALNVRDWNNAYKYYESICKITKSDKDIAIFNALGYICGKLQFYDKFAIDCRELELDMRILLLNEMKNYTKALKARDMEIATQNKNNSNNKQKSESTLDVYLRYDPILKTLNTEINHTKPIRCLCGNYLQCTDEKCSQCGKSRKEVLEDKANDRKFTNSILYAVLSIIFGTFTFSGRMSKIGFIITAVLLIMAVSGLNKTSKTEALKTKLNRLFLPIMTAVPVTLMVLLGFCFKPNKPNADISTLKSAIIETTEQTTARKTKISSRTTTKTTTAVQTETTKEKPTEPSTEKITEEVTEEFTEPPTEEITGEISEPPTEEPTEDEEPEIITHEYVINYNTGKFHLPSCYTIKKSTNTGTYNGTKDELESQGYQACKKCKPY